MKSRQISYQRAKKAGHKFYFTGKPCSRGHLSYRYVSTRECLECKRELRREWRARNREKARAYHRDWYYRNREHAIRYAKTWVEENSERARNNRRTWYRENRARVLEEKKREREENPERLRRMEREWRRKNPEKAREYDKRWYQRNKGANAAQTVAYNCAKMRAHPSWAKEDRRIDKMYEAARLIMNQTGEKIHVDHIIPLRGKTVCGLHVYENLQILPAGCNCEKSNTVYEDEET